MCSPITKQNKIILNYILLYFVLSYCTVYLFMSAVGLFVILLPLHPFSTKKVHAHDSLVGNVLETGLRQVRLMECSLKR